MEVARIHLLNPLLANQIAAGEIVERPASVLKELLENSLDAGATQIEINVEKGGKQLLRIQDNGSGIHPDDLLLAASRHATSKISSLEDLAEVKSLGFRGEALASIAAVSRFRLISATTEQNAQQLIVEGESLQMQPSPAARLHGTTVEVRELFFNVPVRRRFLRSDKTEFAHLLDITNKIALSRPQVAITLTHNKKLILRFSAANELLDQTHRIMKICGKTFMQKGQHFSEEAQGLLLQGWITCANESYPHTNVQYFFLNGRIVRDKLLNHALRVAAQDFLPAGRYLAYVLYFSCNANCVDVNVHPTKHEVHFQESRLVHDFIVQALRRTWQQQRLEEASTPYVSNIIPPIVAAHIATSIDTTKQEEMLTTHVPLDRRHEPKANIIKHSEVNNQLASKHIGRAIDLIHQRYLLVETQNGLTIIDCIAANQVIYSQQLRNATLTRPLASKALLWPISLTLTATQLQALQNKTIDWQTFNIEWQASSAQQMIIRRLPNLLAKADHQALFAALSGTDEAIVTIAHFAAQSQLPSLLEEKQELLRELADFSAIELKRIQQVIHLI